MSDASTVVNLMGAGERALMLVPLFPLIGAAIVYAMFNGQKSKHAFSGWVATIAALASFLTVAFKLYPHIGVNGVESISATLWNWFAVDGLNVSFSLRFDRLAAVMSLIVTGVGTLIHLYAIGYMAEDEHRPRFFCYLNLFLFAMLLLVLGDNLLVMFVGWEGVGLCSYLLIGFWFREMANSEAGQKAFVVNRIGDAGFLLGVFTLVISTGVLDFSSLSQAATTLPPMTIELICLLLFVGAVGKSAQIPLYVWLPDAMAGPTPVSALIHAATMVTAGIYMITRLSFLFSLAPVALLVIGVIGTLTALLAATIALVQNDIKKVLAYSTVSQLGYMFMALGAGAFSNGIYHVVTHAFFKACLFMCAGSVIIGCHHQQDMREYGGLRKHMPLTFICYLVATLAIAGFPFLSGFYSKDAILWTVFSATGLSSEIHLAGIQLSHLLWGIGLFTAFLTAFYMTRSLMMTFFGEYRGHEHPHESPWVVTVPLLILATLSAGFAYLYGEAMMRYLAAWTRADMLVGHHGLAENHTYHQLEMLSIGIAIGGIVLAIACYIKVPSSIATSIRQKLPVLYRLLEHKWLVDELYGAMIVRPLGAVSALLFSVLDRSIIDAAVNGTGLFVEANGEVVRKIHSGRISHYIAILFGGATFFTLFWLLLG